MLPIADLTSPPDVFAEAFLDACETTGFVAVTGHGIPDDVISKLRTQLHVLFAMSPADKTALMITPENYRGFIPLGFFTPNRVEVNGDDADRYEGFKLHWECPPDHGARRACALYGPNRWPDAQPSLRDAVLEYWAGCDRLAARLLDVCAEGLDVPAATLAAWHEAPLTNMTLLHYPPSPPSLPSAPGKAAMGIHPHKDTNVLTILHPDPVGGLEVRGVDGTWIEATAPEGALVVNVGEMLELWSGGRFTAAPHRVINRSGRERYSFPWFLVPNHAVTVDVLGPAVEGFSRPPMPVGALSAEVWRTNWPDEKPANDGHDLGSLDR